MMIRKTRRADGQRETIADTRFFDLRESGYTGPIDFRTGHPIEVTADSYWAHRARTTAPESAWRVLRVPVISVALVLVLAVVYVVALRADAMALCAALWVPIALATATFVVSAIRISRQH